MKGESKVSKRIKVLPTTVMGVALLSPLRHEDERGWFLRHFCLSELEETGLHHVKQANLVATSKKNTFRGFHFQVSPGAESKIFSCLSGKITMIAVDMRASSPTFLDMAVVELRGVSQHLLLTPPGVAVGYLSQEGNVLVHYYSTAAYNPDSERGFRWNDPLLSRSLPLRNPVLSPKDSSWPNLSLEEISNFRFD
jgi:dTDP-4-dehydrorhamnose 3,5-epimerase